MKNKLFQLHEKNRKNLGKYRITAWFYDILDCPWERVYKKWRPQLVGDLSGEVLEAGIGTGRNLRYYSSAVNLTALDFSSSMLIIAGLRAREAKCNVTFIQEDASVMPSVPSGHYDWVLATFLCCVIPEDLQRQVIGQFVRILKPGGRFRLLEIVFSKDPAIRRRQEFFAPFVEGVYGARFDRHTLRHVEETEELLITSKRYLKDDTYLLIEGMKKP